jgi:hypothetical protein
MDKNKTEYFSPDDCYDIFLSLDYTNDEFIENRIVKMN